MEFNNYLIESDTQTFSATQEAIRRLLLGGLDVRLTPVSRNRALLPKHILDAIAAQYNCEPWQFITQQTGVRFDSIYPLPDSDALALVMHRSEAELDARPNIVVPPVQGMQWHLHNINVPNAWQLLGGPDSITWSCKVGQIDTGFTKHPALGFLPGQASWIVEPECRNFYSPGEYSNQEVGPPTGEDPRSGAFWGHGTRIGATISGWHKNGDQGQTFYGCAPKVPHVMVRISNTVAINDQLSAFSEALDHLVDHAKVAVVNLSMGTFPPLLTAQAKKAIDRAYERGVILVCAGGQHVSPVVAPASYGRTIAVGATNSQDQVWAKASRGPQIDWSAPGVDIRRATLEKKDGPFVYRNNGDGTSYSTALTTGVAALWLNFRAQDIKAAYPEPWMRVAAFKEIGRRTVRRPGNWGDGVAGAGILDAFAVLNAPLPTSGSLTKEASVH